MPRLALERGRVMGDTVEVLCSEEKWDSLSAPQTWLATADNGEQITIEGLGMMDAMDAAAEALEVEIDEVALVPARGRP